MQDNMRSYLLQKQKLKFVERNVQINTIFKFDNGKVITPETAYLQIPKNSSLIIIKLFYIWRRLSKWTWLSTYVYQMNNTLWFNLIYIVRSSLCCKILCRHRKLDFCSRGQARRS